MEVKAYIFTFLLFSTDGLFRQDLKELVRTWAVARVWEALYATLSAVAPTLRQSKAVAKPPVDNIKRSYIHWVDAAHTTHTRERERQKEKQDRKDREADEEAERWERGNRPTQDAISVLYLLHFSR